MNILFFLNAVCYSKDKAEHERAQIQKFQGKTKIK